MDTDPDQRIAAPRQGPGAFQTGQGDRFAPPSPGWYPSPGGEQGTRYWDGHNWAATNSWTDKRGRRQVRQWFGAFIAALFGFLLLCWGAYDFNQYRVATPTTATVTHCSGKGDCDGAWSLDGVSQTRSIERGFSTFAVGSSLDVRVSDVSWRGPGG